MGDFSLFSYSKEDKMKVLEELGYTELSIAEDVDAVMDWFEKQPHLVEAGIDPVFVEKLLIMSKGSREKTKSRIDKYYKYRALSPDLIQSRKEILQSDENIWTFYRQAITSKQFNGRRVTVLQFPDPNPSSFSTEELFRNSYMSPLTYDFYGKTCSGTILSRQPHGEFFYILDNDSGKKFMVLIGDLRAKFDYIFNEIWLIDFKNITLGHFLRLNPMVVQRASQMFQEGLSLKVSAVHVLNAPAFGYQILSLFKRFIKPKILDRLMVHASLDELHKVLPKQYLPKDYGGEDLSMDEFREKYQKELRSEKTKQFLLNGCKRISDEKKRPGAIYNEEYIVGTFKKLDLD